MTDLTALARELADAGGPDLTDSQGQLRPDALEVLLEWFAEWASVDLGTEGVNWKVCILQDIPPYRERTFRAPTPLAACFKAALWQAEQERQKGVADAD